MDFGRIGRIQPSTVPAQHQERTSASRERVMNKLGNIMSNWRGCSPQERITIKKSFFCMWSTEKAQIDSSAFAKMQLKLLKDMDENLDLRRECLHVARKGLADYEETFDMFLTQQKVCEESNSTREPQQQFNNEFSWQGQGYNRICVSPEKLDRSDKSYPYISKKGAELVVNLNGQAHFIAQKPTDPTNKKIMCIHLATQYIKDIFEEQGGAGKVNWSLYSSPRAIAAHIPLETAVAHETLKANANRYDLIDNNNLGKHVKACFEDMQRSGETLRALLIHSTVHAMAIKLRIKGTVEQPVYVIHFYDPTETNADVRCAIDDLSMVENQTLQQYLDILDTEGQNYYESYYKETKPISYVMECNLASFRASPVRDKKNLSNPAPTLPTPTYLFFLLKYNFTDELTELKHQLQEIGQERPEELVELLAAKGADDTSGLYWALHYGHTEGVKIYRALLQILPETEHSKLFDLLTTKSENGTSGLSIAAMRGHAETIKAYGKLLQLLPKAEYGRLADLLAANEVHGFPGLYLALEKGHAEVVKAYGELLQLLPEAEYRKLIRLLAAKDADGNPGLYIALEAGQGEAVRAYGELLKLLPETEHDQLVELLVAKSQLGTPGLNMALESGHADAVKAYGELLQLFPNMACDKLVELLAAKDAKGNSGLYWALEDGHTETIKAYKELLQLIPRRDGHKLVEFLAKKCTLALREAENNGHTETVKAYRELLRLT